MAATTSLASGSSSTIRTTVPARRERTSSWGVRLISRALSRCTALGAGASGSRTRNVTPVSPSVSALMVPPCRSMMSRTSPRPRPNFARAEFLAGSCWRCRLKRYGRAPASTPTPASWIVSSACPLSDAFRRDVDRSGVGREMKGAREQRDQHLANAQAVGVQRRRQRVHLEIEGDRLLVCFLHGVHRLVHQLLGVNRRHLELKVAREQPPRVHHFVDQLELLLRLPDDGLPGAHNALFGQRLAFDELGPSDDAVERPAQIVCGDAQVIVRESIHPDCRRVECWERFSWEVASDGRPWFSPILLPTLVHRMASERRQDGASRAVRCSHAGERMQDESPEESGRSRFCNARTDDDGRKTRHFDSYGVPE